MKTMKRSRTAAVIAALCLSLSLLTACSGASAPAMEEGLWTLTTVQSAATGGVIACGEDAAALWPEAEVISLTCTAAQGEFLLYDAGAEESYIGTYEYVSTDGEAVTYSLRLGDASGVAVSAMTSYADGSQKPTLILALGDYTLNFFAAEE